MRGGILLCLIAILACIPAVGYAGSKKTQVSSVDMSKYSCADFLSEDEEGASDVLLWLDGYLSCKRGSTRVNFEALSGLKEELEAVCNKNRNAVLLDAVTGITGVKKR